MTTNEQIIEMLEQSIHVHQWYIDEQSVKLSILNTISECIKTLTNNLNCYDPQSYSYEKTQLCNLHYDIHVQLGRVLTNISKHKKVIDKLELEIQKLEHEIKELMKGANNNE